MLKVLLAVSTILCLASPVYSQDISSDSSLDQWGGPSSSISRYLFEKHLCVNEAVEDREEDVAYCWSTYGRILIMPQGNESLVFCLTGADRRFYSNVESCK